jgi:hypothetical protein
MVHLHKSRSQANYNIVPPHQILYRLGILDHQFFVLPNIARILCSWFLISELHEVMLRMEEISNECYVAFAKQRKDGTVCR